MSPELRAQQLAKVERMLGSYKLVPAAMIVGANHELIDTTSNQVLTAPLGSRDLADGLLAALKLAAELVDANKAGVIDVEGVPQATSFEVGLCPTCDFVHIVMLGDADQPVIVGSSSPQEWDEIVADVAEERAERIAAQGMGPAQGNA